MTADRSSSVRPLLPDPAEGFAAARTDSRLSGDRVGAYAASSRPVKHATAALEAPAVPGFVLTVAAPAAAPVEVPVIAPPAAVAASARFVEAPAPRPAARAASALAAATLVRPQQLVAIAAREAPEAVADVPVGPPGPGPAA